MRKLPEWRTKTKNNDKVVTLKKWYFTYIKPKYKNILVYSFVSGIIIYLHTKSVNKMEDYKFLFKVVLVGNAGVGKTCLVRRFTQGMFPPGQGATIGVDFMIKTVEIDGEKIKVICSILFGILWQ